MEVGVVGGGAGRCWTWASCVVYYTFGGKKISKTLIYFKSLSYMVGEKKTRRAGEVSMRKISRGCGGC